LCRKEVGLVSMNPALTEMMAQTRMADMRRAAPTRLTSRRVASANPAGANLLPELRLTARPAAARRAIGWFLVGVGLRLAVSQPRSASAR
jgi:hypothetical protein